MSEACPRPARRVASNNPSAAPGKRLSPHDRAIALRKEQQVRSTLESRSNSSEFEYVVIEEEVEEDDDDDEKDVIAGPPVAVAPGRGAIVVRLASTPSSPTDSSDTSYVYEEDEETEFTPSEQPAFLQMAGVSPLSQSLEPTFNAAAKSKRTLSPRTRRSRVSRAANGAGDATWSAAEVKGTVSMESFQRSASNLTGWTGAHFLTPRNSGEKILDPFERLQRGAATGMHSPHTQDVVRGHTPQRQLPPSGIRRGSESHPKPVALTDELLNPLRHRGQKRPANAERRAGRKAGEPAQVTSSPTPAGAAEASPPTRAVRVEERTKPGGVLTITTKNNNNNAAPTAADVRKTSSPHTGPSVGKGGGFRPPHRALLRTAPGLSPEAQLKATAPPGTGPKLSVEPTNGGTTAMKPTPAAAAASATTAATTTTTSGSAARPGVNPTGTAAQKLATLPAPPPPNASGNAAPTQPPTGAPRPQPPPADARVPPAKGPPLLQSAFTRTPTTGSSNTTPGVLSPNSENGTAATTTTAAAKRTPAMTTIAPHSGTDPVMRARRNSVPAPAPGVRSLSVGSSTASRPLPGASTTTLPPGAAADTILSDPSSSSTPTKWNATSSAAKQPFGPSDSPNSAGETLAATSSRGTCGDANLAGRRKRAPSSHPTQLKMIAVDMITPSVQEEPLSATNPTTAAPAASSKAPEKKLVVIPAVSTNTKVPNKPLTQHQHRSNSANARATESGAATATPATKSAADDAAAAILAKKKAEEAVRKKREELLAKKKQTQTPGEVVLSPVAPALTATSTANKMSTPRTAAIAAAAPLNTQKKPVPAAVKPAPKPAPKLAPSPSTANGNTTSTPPVPPPRQISAPTTTTAAPIKDTENTTGSPVLRTLPRPGQTTGPLRSTPRGDAAENKPADPVPTKAAAATAAAEKTNCGDVNGGGNTSASPRTHALPLLNASPRPLPLPPSAQQGGPSTESDNDKNKNSNNNNNAATRTRSGSAAVTTPPTSPPHEGESEGDISPAHRARRRSGGHHVNAGGRTSLMTSQVLFDETNQSGTTGSERDDAGTREDSSRPHRYKRVRRKSQQQQLCMVEIPTVTGARLDGPGQKPVTGTMRTAAAGAGATHSPHPDRGHQGAQSGTAAAANNANNTVPAALRGATLYTPATANTTTPTATTTSTPAGTTNAIPVALQGATLRTTTTTTNTTPPAEPAANKHIFSNRFTTGERTESAPYRRAVSDFNQTIEAQIKAMADRQQEEEKAQEESHTPSSRARMGAGAFTAVPAAGPSQSRRRPQSTLPHTKPSSRFASTQSVREPDVPVTLPPHINGLAQASAPNTATAYTETAVLPFSEGKSPRPGVRSDAGRRQPPTVASARLRASNGTAAATAMPRASSYTEAVRQANGSPAGATRTSLAARASLPPPRTAAPSSTQAMADADTYVRVPPIRSSDIRRQSSQGLAPSSQPVCGRASLTATEAVTHSSSTDDTGLPLVHRRSTTRPISNVRTSEYLSQMGSMVNMDPNRHRRRVQLHDDEAMLMEDSSDVDDGNYNDSMSPSPQQRTLSKDRRRSHRVA